MLVLSGSTGYLYIGWDSSGGYLFFLKIFVESKRGELSKTENKLLGRGASPIITGEGFALNTTTGDPPIGILEVVGTGRMNGQGGGGSMGWGIVSCLLSLG